MTTYTNWKTAEYDENTAIIEHLRNQVKTEMEKARLAEVEEAGVRGVRNHLAAVLDEAGEVEGVPDVIVDALKLAYNLFWELDK